MAYPSKNVDLFHRVARERLEGAEYLLRDGRGTAAVYLGGYVVECALKMLILASVPRKSEDEILQTFRGAAAHSYDHLARQLTSSGRVEIPRTVKRNLANVAGWQVEGRYNPGKLDPKDARAFLDSAESVLQWAERKL